MGNSMGCRVDTQELAKREWLTPRQCAQVFGRGPDFWAARFDDPECEVTGYTESTGRGTARYIETATARAYLHRLGVLRRVQAKSGRHGLMDGFRDILARNPAIKSLNRAQHAPEG
ncbi:MAG: hypothetical protein IT364_12930 [Candidatus Hydrogenedentes bacterium]|nr:hypothetical protein [Candidatus Hydrogenedentota bacterium]